MDIPRGRGDNVLSMFAMSLASWHRAEQTVPKAKGKLDLALGQSASSKSVLNPGYVKTNTSLSYARTVSGNLT